MSGVKAFFEWSHLAASLKAFDTFSKGFLSSFERVMESVP